jgi:hypothetical protein
MRRSGATLIEVLVAIFVMAIGLMSLLALFPLGALRMSQAIQDDRCGNIGLSADGVAMVANIRNDPLIYNPTAGTNLYQNPGGGFPAANPDGPSYPVLVDPIGFRTFSGVGNAPLWLGGPATPGPSPATPTIRRSSATLVEGATALTPTQAALRWFTFLDDIYFDPTGRPDIQGFTFQREPRYSVAYMCQRPRLADASVTNLAVVVFNERAMGLSGNLTLDNEYVYDGSLFDLTSSTVTINFTGTAPPVREGGWILDSTYMGPTAANPTANPWSHGYFYRVVGINDTGTNTVVLEVQTPFRGFPAGTTSYTGTVIVLEGVAEVFEKGDGRLP